MVGYGRSEMRRASATFATALAAAGVLVLPATAQEPENVTDTPPNLTTFTAKARVVPNRAGTPENPQGVVIHSSARAVTEPGYERPIFQGGYALFPRHGNYNGDDFPRCDKRTLDRSGTEGCPKRSRIGGGTGVAYADEVVTRPRIEIFNGGSKLALAYVTLYRPALVREAIPVRIQELPRGKWKYKASFSVPEVLQVVAGIPIAAGSLKFHVGRGNLIETTSCPKSRRWPYEIRGHFSNGSDYTYRGSSPCKPPLPGR
jgi:hypothetical protein